ncbi:Pycsar system effector family protein [Nocardia tengchongensis]
MAQLEAEHYMAKRTVAKMLRDSGAGLAADRGTEPATGATSVDTTTLGSQMPAGSALSVYSYMEMVVAQWCSVHMKPGTAKKARSRFRMDRLGPSEDLTTGLQTVSEINRVIAAVDVKVGLLLTANGIELTGLIAASHTQTTGLACVATAIPAMSLLVCMLYLAFTLRPNLRGAGAGNWFSFPSFPTEIDQRPGVATLADQAWREAATLAEVARGKYRRFQVALRCSAVSLIAFVVWFTASLWN